MRSKFVVVGVLVSLVSQFSNAGTLPADKRTILTSGEKVYPIRYSLGQSTVLYFGLKPEIVICGNKNYFNIEKIKDGITIQPLASFSTNLTVMSSGRRYLFFLTPAASARPDGFVEVRWIPPEEARPVYNPKKNGVNSVRELGIRTKLGAGYELTIARSKQLADGAKQILELELKSANASAAETSQFEMVVEIGGRPVEKQVLAWESEMIGKSRVLKGRLIYSSPSQTATLLVGIKGKTTKISIPGVKNRN